MAELKFAVDDQKWAEKLRAGEHRLLEMIATFGVDLVENTKLTRPLAVALTPP
jgi:predicted nucleic acid-binding Zn ribbon protein